MSEQRTNMFPTRIAVFGIEGLKAGAAVGASLLHDVTLASQHCLTLKTAKVLHVPVTALRLCALIRKDDLRERRYERVSFITGVLRGKTPLGYYSLLNDGTKSSPPSSSIHTTFSFVA